MASSDPTSWHSLAAKSLPEPGRGWPTVPRNRIQQKWWDIPSKTRPQEVCGFCAPQIPYSGESSCHGKNWCLQLKATGVSLEVDPPSWALQWLQPQPMPCSLSGPRESHQIRPHLAPHTQKLWENPCLLFLATKFWCHVLPGNRLVNIN